MLLSPRISSSYYVFEAAVKTREVRQDARMRRRKAQVTWLWWWRWRWRWDTTLAIPHITFPSHSISLFLGQSLVPPSIPPVFHLSRLPLSFLPLPPSCRCDGRRRTQGPGLREGRNMSPHSLQSHLKQIDQ